MFYPILILFTVYLNFSLLSDWTLSWTSLRAWPSMATLKFLWIVLFFFPVLYYQWLYRLTFCSPLIIPFLQFKVPVYLFSSHTKVVSHWSSLLLFLHFPVLLYFYFFFQVGWSEYHSLLKIWTYCGLQKYNISSVFQIISYFFSFFFSLLVNVELLFSEIVCRFPHYLFFWVAVAGKYILNVHVQLGLFFFYILALIYQQWNFFVVLLCSHSVLQDDSGILRNQL